MIKYIKGAVFLSVLTAIICLLGGCGGGEKLSDYERIHKRLSEMTEYKAECRVTYYTGLGEDTYETLQAADRDGRYRIESAKTEDNGISILYDGDMIWLYNPSVKSRIQVASGSDDKRREIILFSFLKNEERAGEETTVAAAASEGENFITFEAEIPGDDPDYFSEKLFMDIKSGDPKRLVIYNDKGKEHITAEFTKFEYNPGLTGEEFKISSLLNEKEVE